MKAAEGANHSPARVQKQPLAGENFVWSSCQKFAHEGIKTIFLEMDENDSIVEGSGKSFIASPLPTVPEA